jgi:hypothetical protein
MNRSLLAAGSHVCLLYESLAEQKKVVLPFVLEGLQRGEQCVYVAHEQPVDDWCLEFQAYGVDVGHELQSRRLIVCAGERWRGIGEFTSVANARQVWAMIEDAFAAFNGIRFVVDAGWMLEPAVAVDRLCHWEATLNPLIEGYDEVRVLCQYNVSRHSAAAVHSALRTHPAVLFGGQARSNPFYEAPRILEYEPDLNHSEAEAGMIEGMLLQLAEQPEPY